MGCYRPPGVAADKVAATTDLKTLLRVIFTGRYLNSVVGDFNKSWTFAESFSVCYLLACFHLSVYFFNVYTFTLEVPPKCLTWCVSFLTK